MNSATFVLNLKQDDPRTRLQALNGLARIGDKKTAPAILTMPGMANLDAGKIDEVERRIVPHVAVKALAALRAEEACLAAVKDGKGRALAFRALQEMHTAAAVDGLITIAQTSTDPEVIEGALITLARLHFKEKEWGSQRMVVHASR